MIWAEQFGLGEMQLDPDVFWRLTVREFWIKHDAFIRDQDRQEAAWLRHAARTTANLKKEDRRNLLKAANYRTRYPLKPWLQPKSP